MIVEIVHGQNFGWATDNFDQKIDEGPPNILIGDTNLERSNFEYEMIAKKLVWIIQL
jgi:hypothetical protein